MDIENVKSWITQPDVCRCCLSASGAWDLTATYIAPGNVTEEFFIMLQECYNITLSHLSEWGPSRMICSLCADQLRGAHKFRKKVAEAEQHFVEAYEKKRDTVLVSNIKCEIIKTECQDYDDDDTCTDYRAGACSISDENISKTPLQETPNSKVTKKRKQRKSRAVKRSDECSTVDPFDSDTPIAALNKEIETNSRLEKMLEVKSQDLITPESHHVAGSIIQETHQPVTRLKQENGVKQLSERKMLTLTCNIVLRDTNACPFRHHKSWFQCFFCTEEFMEINILRTHVAKCHSDTDSELMQLKRYPRSLQIDITDLKCIRCTELLNNVNEMQKHFRVVHKKTIYNECIADYKVNRSPYTCHICKQEFHMFRSLTTHLNDHYANCICDVCGKSFINSKRLKVHKRTHEKGSFPCLECGKVLKTKTSKANHMESAHSKRILKCHLCAEPMKHYNDRIKHMSEVHNITHKFKCPICSREYNIKHYLATHLRQTHGHKNKKCLECGMAFITNHGLKKHMLKHTGEKPFVCQLCCKSYARNYTLREHMRTHENENKFLAPE